MRQCIPQDAQTKLSSWLKIHNKVKPESAAAVSAAGGCLMGLHLWHSPVHEMRLLFVGVLRGLDQVCADIVFELSPYRFHRFAPGRDILGGQLLNLRTVFF